VDSPAEGARRFRCGGGLTHGRDAVAAALAWIDASADRDTMLRTIWQCPHEQLLVARNSIDEPLGMVVKSDLLHRVLDGQPLDPLAVIREPLVVHESMPIFRVLDMFKKTPVRLAMIINEYGSLEGIVTQTDLLEAMAGDLPDAEGEEAEIIEREDGSLLINGLMPAHEAFGRLGFRARPGNDDFHTIAGFALSQLRQLPSVGDTFSYEDWHFEVLDMDGRRIDKLLAWRQLM
jgi:putative hemolysin